MEDEECIYCGSPVSAHAPYPWDHKPILLSKIMDEALAESKKPSEPGSAMAKFRDALLASSAAKEKL